MLRTSSYHLYPLRINGVTEEQRDAILQKIFDMEVSVNVHFIPVPMMSFYQTMNYRINDYPNTYRLYSEEISLPVYYDLTDEQVNTVVRSVVESVHEIMNQ